MKTQSNAAKRNWGHGFTGLALLVGLSGTVIAVAAEGRPTAVKPAARAAKPVAAKPAAVSYEKDVKPILVARCYACHGNGTRLGGFQIDSREGLLTGSEATHPVVQPGKGAASYLIKLVSGGVPGKIMPPKGARLTAREVGVLRAWIDQGLNFGSGTGASAWRPQLELKEPALPAATAGVTHPVDRLLLPYLKRNKVAPKALVDDRTYARRVYLDLIGLLPSPNELEAFVVDRSPDKREKLVDKLLADNRRYSEHWLSFWNDLLRNDYTGTGYIDGGRAPITNWLFDALMTNKPYDRFVTELVNPTPESAGFTKGIVWRGVVNASQMPSVQAAQSISQVFLGINLKCASCHDSFINNWKLSDAYGMAGIYADKPLEMVRCDKPTGQVAPVKFLYPQLGGIDGAAAREKRTEQLAAVLTSPQNGRLPRTFVNRMWAKLMGRGLVEPVDEMDHQPWYPELLDWLSSDFSKNGYDVKKLLKRIVTSRAYQLPAMALKTEGGQEFVFSGPVVKRMSAEQFVDAVSSLTGVWSQPAPGAPVELPDFSQLPSEGTTALKFKSGLLKSGQAEIDVDVTGARYLSLVVTDGGNGGSFDWANWAEAKVTAGGTETPLTKLRWHTATAGFGQVRVNRNVVNRAIRIGARTFPEGIGTHANSVITYALPRGATRFRAVAGPDTEATEQRGSQTSVEMLVVTSDRPLLQARAALAASDALTRALGRPNREQVVTWRSPVATTLQAIEMTNGQTLSAALTGGAEAWMNGQIEPTAASQDLVGRVYLRALGRAPTAAERAAALSVVGTPATKAGVEDLLWALIMLPEFQLVY